MPPWLQNRSGIAASVLAHVVLAGAVLLFAEVHPFADAPEQQVAVDVVTADEAPPAPEPKPVEKPAEDKPEPRLDFDVSSKPTEQPQQQRAEPPQTKQAETKPPETKQPEPRPPEAKPEQKAETAPAKPQQPSPAPQPQPAEQQPAQPPSAQAGTQPYPAAIPQEPDITVKYSVALGLPEGPAFDAPAEMAANISAESVAALRKKLKSCAPLPPGLERSDNVKIVLRVALQPDGRLAQEPMMIQGTASTKGPALMRGAMAALDSCQPYNMLPPDKYKEWKVLDLDFTPQDFRGG
ncbi:hypothetical protein [Rhodopseudomonas sp. B29]|uniref:hypothetical protein n=1 Tax=Rhodopseudomonas sp. B29 TaxID=95607 RepID=UPI0004CF2065|nr:hypothetical protein [Rhodopseudomonas sp. B29]